MGPRGRGLGEGWESQKRGLVKYARVGGVKGLAGKAGRRKLVLGWGGALAFPTR